MEFCVGWETHHIVPQAAFKTTNVTSINDMNKNKRHNLVPLCSSCHDDVHRGNIVVEGYVKTSEGINLATR